MDLTNIKINVAETLNSLPLNVTLVAAAKTRTAEQVQAAVEAGIQNLGYNYVQEAEQILPHIKGNVKWHMIGHLQRNKVKKAVKLFDMIETIDSFKLAEVVDKQCQADEKIMPVLIEVNSAEESSKSGVLPNDVDELVEKISKLSHIQVQGLMTMGAYYAEPELMRSYFRNTREAYERITKAIIPNVKMQYLSMGMSNSYLIAIEEGANIVRLGTNLFGPRIT